MSKRDRVNVDATGDWQTILPALPHGYTAVGTVQVGTGDVGVLAQDTHGDFVQLVPTGTQTLDQRKVRVALGLPQSVGKPRMGYEVREVYSVRLEPGLAEFLREAGGGNLSAGISMAGEQYRAQSSKK